MRIVGDDSALRLRACVACAMHTGRPELLRRLGVAPAKVVSEPLASLWAIQAEAPGLRPIDIFLAARSRSSVAVDATARRRLPSPWHGLSFCQSDQVRRRLELAGARLCLLGALSVPGTDRSAWIQRRLQDPACIDLVAAQRAWWRRFEMPAPLAGAWRDEFESQDAAPGGGLSRLRHAAYLVLRSDLARFDASAIEEISGRLRTTLVDRVLQVNPIAESGVPSREILVSLFDVDHSEAGHV